MWKIALLSAVFSLVAISCVGEPDSQDNDGWDLSENQQNTDDCPPDLTWTPEECDGLTYECADDEESFYDPDCGCGCVPQSPDDCPDEDDGYHYQSTDSEQCQYMDIVCESHQEIFHNECGCGCRDTGEPPPIECIDDESAYYVSGDPAECAVIDYTCPAGHEPFDDDCGCGCVPVPGECPDNYHPAENLEECQVIDWGCGGTEELYYHEDCGCGCRQLDEEPCPDESDGYHYVEDDPETCAAIDFTCQEGQQRFDNDCGCGCKDVGFYCSPWDVEPEGACDMVLGYGYDGEECIAYSGCDCIGDDCDRLNATLEGCRKQVRDCDQNCGNPDAAVCFDDPYLNPVQCPDGSAYTVVDCEAMCVEPDTCEQLAPEP